MKLLMKTENASKGEHVLLRSPPWQLLVVYHQGPQAEARPSDEIHLLIPTVRHLSSEYRSVEEALNGFERMTFDTKILPGNAVPAFLAGLAQKLQLMIWFLREISAPH